MMDDMNAQKETIENIKARLRIAGAHLRDKQRELNVVRGIYDNIKRKGRDTILEDMPDCDIELSPEMALLVTQEFKDYCHFKEGDLFTGFIYIDKVYDDSVTIRDNCFHEGGFPHKLICHMRKAYLAYYPLMDSHNPE